MRVMIASEEERDEWDAKILAAVAAGASTNPDICEKLEVPPRTVEATIVARRLQRLRNLGKLRFDNRRWSVQPKYRWRDERPSA